MRILFFKKHMSFCLFPLHKLFIFFFLNGTITRRKYALLLNPLNVCLNRSHKYMFLRDADRGFGKLPMDHSKI